MKEQNTPKTILDVMHDFWDAKYYMLISMILMAVVGVLYLSIATPHYRAQMIISPAAPMNNANVSSLMAGSDNFAVRYMMQNMGSINAADFQRFETIYAGRSVALNLMQDQRVIDGISRDHSFAFSKTKTNWSAEKLAEYLGSRVRLDSVGTTPMRRLTYQHQGKDFAVFMLSKIHAQADRLIRRRIQSETQSRIEYLERSIRQTNNPDHRRALTDLLMEQERLLMLVSIESAYAASVIEPPSASVQPRWPSKTLVMLVSVFVGLVLGFVAFNLRQAIKRAKEAPVQSDFAQGQKTSKRWQEWLSNAADNTNTNIQKKRDNPKPKRSVRGVLSSKDAAE